MDTTAEKRTHTIRQKEHTVLYIKIHSCKDEMVKSVGLRFRLGFALPFICDIQQVASFVLSFKKKGHNRYVNEKSNKALGRVGIFIKRFICMVPSIY